MLTDLLLLATEKKWISLSELATIVYYVVVSSEKTVVLRARTAAFLPFLVDTIATLRAIAPFCFYWPRGLTNSRIVAWQKNTVFKVLFWVKLIALGTFALLK